MKISTRIRNRLAGVASRFEPARRLADAAGISLARVGVRPCRVCSSDLVTEGLAIGDIIRCPGPCGLELVWDGADFWSTERYGESATPRAPGEFAGDAPFNCPRCAGRIERDDATPHEAPVYVCRGIADRAEAEKYLGKSWRGRVPDGCESLPACGWSAPAADYGVTWR